MSEQIMTVQVKGRVVTGLTDDGRFIRRRWRGPLPAVGALVSVPAAPVRGLRSLAFAATAALLILVMQLPFLAPFAQAGTVVTVDINPSFELVLTPSGRVTRIRAMNTDAEPIVAQLEQLPPTLPEAMTAILAATAAAGRLPADSDNLVLVGVVPGWRGLPPGLDLKGLESSLAEELGRLNVSGLVHVAGARAVDLAKARINKLSVNRYLLVRDLKARGQDVTLSEARGKSASQLLKDHGVEPDDIVPGQRCRPDNPGNSDHPTGGNSDAADHGKPDQGHQSDPGNGGSSGNGHGDNAPEANDPGEDHSDDGSDGHSGNGSGSTGGQSGGKQPGKSPGH